MMRVLTLATFALSIGFIAQTSSAQLLPLELPERLALDTGARFPALASSLTGENLLLYAATEGPEAGKLHAVLLERLSSEAGGGWVVSADPITFSPSVAALPGGDWLAVWSTKQGSVPRVHVRRLGASGEPISAEIVLATLDEDPRSSPTGASTIGCAPDGSCVVAWQSEDAGISAQRVDGNGTALGPVFTVRPVDEEEDFYRTVRGLKVAMAADGRFAVLWVDDELILAVVGRASLPRARIFRADGVALTEPFSLDLLPTGPAHLVSRVGGAWNEQGQLLATWDAIQSLPQEAPGGSLRARLFDTVGSPVGERVTLETILGGLGSTAVWCSAEQRFLVAWLRFSAENSIAYRYQPQVQRFSAAGEPEGRAMAIPRVSSQTLDQPTPSLGSPLLSCGVAGEARALWSEYSVSTGERLVSHTIRSGQPVCSTPFVPNPPEAVPCVSLGPEGRYLAYAAFRGAEGKSRPAGPIQVTRDAASFFFNSGANPEIYAKVVDGRVLNDHFWLFYGALSNQEYMLAVYDRATGLSRTYYNPAQILASRGDTHAFPEAPPDASVVLEPLEIEDELFGRAASGGCLGLANSLCLTDEAFTVTMDWVDFQGRPGQARAVQQTNLSGYFTFVNPNNVELAIKILDGRAINGKWWVFYASLTNVEFTLTIRAANGQIIKQYQNPRASFGSLADTGAF